MSDPISPASHDGDDTDPAERTRVRRRMVRGTDPKGTGEEAAETGPSTRGRSRKRPAIANPFPIEPTSTDALPAEASTSTDLAVDVIGADDENGEKSAPAEATTAEEDGEESGRRKRRRGGRGRRGRGRGESDDRTAEAEEATASEDAAWADAPAPEDQTDAGTDEDDAAATDTPDGGDDESQEEEDGDSRGAGSRRRRRGRRGRGRRSSSKVGVTPSEPAEPGGGSTRLSARTQRTGGGGRRRIPSVSPETRRAMAESPPKRMLVTVGAERTQIAVLEERTLVEHYVTQASEASYVGNIYKGRVQNVLPGMEAAFVDIGTPKNGVLYRGDVAVDTKEFGNERPKIEKVLKNGQTIMVQVTKNPIAHKGARLTQEVSLPGRFVVLIPNSSTYGISKRLPDDERKRLRQILDKVKPTQHGVIVRTAAEGVSTEELERDVLRLVSQWEQIDALAQRSPTPSLLYREPDMAVRIIREEFNAEFRGVVINDRALFEEVRDY
ncbi:MAG TPA: ribonuclease E/G, partial [Euzebya sp.]|nr:ribonuclease E/G [Euzebya sp.]